MIRLDSWWLGAHLPVAESDMIARVLDHFKLGAQFLVEVGDFLEVGDITAHGRFRGIDDMFGVAPGAGFANLVVLEGNFEDGPVAAAHAFAFVTESIHRLLHGQNFCKGNSTLAELLGFASGATIKVFPSCFIGEALIRYGKRARLFRLLY